MQLFSNHQLQTANCKLITMKQYKIIPILLLPILMTTGCGLLQPQTQPTGSSSAKKKVAGSCISGNCSNGVGVWKYDDGIRYEGPFASGRPGGFGALYLPSGAEFTGEFTYGRYTGKGDVVFSDGTPAACERGNCVNGRGIIHFEDDSIYAGQFKDGTREGSGGMHFDDGSTYSGNFKNNEYHGEGTLTDPDGTEYKGEFKNGKLHGEIDIIFPTNHHFKGLFKRGKRVKNQGLLVFPNGNKARCIKGNCIDGEATLSLENGPVYIGQLHKASRHGTGKFIFPSGASYEGEYQNGERHGQGTFIFPSGLVYEGIYQEGKRHGPGTFTFPNSQSVKVFFFHGKMK